MIFEDKYCLVKDIYIQGENEKQSFLFDQIEEEQTVFLAMGSNIEIWHKRLGHYHHYGLLLMKRKQMAKDLHVLDENPPNREACHYGKQCRLPFLKAT